MPVSVMIGMILYAAVRQAVLDLGDAQLGGEMLHVGAGVAISAA